MATCYFCETEFTDGLSICPRCGKQQPTPAEQRRTLIRGIICIGCVVLVAIILSLVNGVRPHF
jgi:hypothetical protein